MHVNARPKRRYDNPQCGVTCGTDSDGTSEKRGKYKLDKRVVNKFFKC